MSSVHRPHIERTAEQPRDKVLQRAQLTAISRIAPNLRLFTLTLLPPFSKFTVRPFPALPALSAVLSLTSHKFEPGQWLDVYVPSPTAPSPGGFTILSPPSILPKIQLAIQSAPQNPPVAWLFQDESAIEGKELIIRVGGSFTFPPANRDLNVGKLEHIVFIGAGVGINPLLSMLQHIRQYPPNEAVNLSFLYSTKPPVPEPYMKILLKLPPEDLQLFITTDGAILEPHHRRRMTAADIRTVIKKFPEDRTLVYVCGPQEFTDKFIDVIEEEIEFLKDRVLTEKWW